MTDLTWLIAIIWLVLTIAGFSLKETALLGAAGIVGLFFGLTLMSEVVWLGSVLVIFSLVVLYQAMAISDKRR